VEFIFAGLLRLIPLEQDNSAAFVAGGKVVAGLVELDGGNDVGFCDVFYVALVTEASVKKYRQQSTSHT
jgi:hypothetical protein